MGTTRGAMQQSEGKMLEEDAGQSHFAHVAESEWIGRRTTDANLTEERGGAIRAVLGQSKQPSTHLKRKRRKSVVPASPSASQTHCNHISAINLGVCAHSDGVHGTAWNSGSRIGVAVNPR